MVLSILFKRTGQNIRKKDVKNISQSWKFFKKLKLPIYENEDIFYEEEKLMWLKDFQFLYIDGRRKIARTLNCTYLLNM